MFSSDQKKHVAVLPFPYTSHPMVLAKHVLRLAAAAPKVHFSFVNTPNSNNLIFPPHSKHDLPTNLKIYDMAAAAPSGLNPEEESEWYFDTAPQRCELVMEAAVVEIGGVPVSCLITDVFTASASEIARKMNVKWIAFWPAAPFSLLAHLHLLHNAHQEEEDDDDLKMKQKKIDFVPGLSMMQLGDLPAMLLEAAGNGNVTYAAIVRTLAETGSVLPKAAAVVLNCFEEENLNEATSVLRSKVDKTLVLNIGCPNLQISFTQLDSDQSGSLSWLDRQIPTSVVYVGSGTMLLLPPGEVLAIAEALEERKTPYIWSLKDHQIHLPPGFVERTSSYGKVVAWAPQTLVLSHPSVGAHLTLAGHNSVMESIVGEVPMICRPLWGDQLMNSRMVEEVWQIGVGVNGGIITKKGLVKCLEMVLGDGEEGKRMREKIKALKEVMVDAASPNGSSTTDFNTLVELISQ